MTGRIISGQEAVSSEQPTIVHKRCTFAETRVNKSKLLTAHCSQLTGFTLLELMIVISIIIILAAVALPQYQRTIVHTRETVLRDDLFQMRKMIDQYAADKGKLPQSLEDLVTDKYLREIPEDPITQEKEWDVITGEDPGATDGGSGVVEVRSRSPLIGTNGKPYSEW